MHGTTAGDPQLQKISIPDYPSPLFNCPILILEKEPGGRFIKLRTHGVIVGTSYAPIL